ncbi:type IV pilus modification protein PilV [Aquipseudomonas alcaligenes]|jgi:type IV pilus assembly protein PilV|uniref:Type IV pilus assembly protein PilV n=1 Tax=Aquipseudomonas alcaligenes TaxID=43263 RepID=A0A1N6TVG5_AQUAC|nr:type IV pilus modification protein PilV [Pseudomonas alcaligenes]SIQ57355.1 type IV pilus assembly protein PilV [Pseudomonas alcaligenes]
MKHRIRGFTLIEVMIALVILAVGLLGMASLMVRSQQSNEGAYSRSQASILAYDIIERMRANKVQTSPLETRKVSYATQDSAYAMSSLPSCATPANGQQAAGNAQATQDIAQWCQAVRNSLPNVDATNTSISRNGNLYTVRIQWVDATADQDSQQFIQVVAEL